MKRTGYGTAAGCLMLAAAAALAGCQRVTPVRTLPNWVRSVYIPMVQNHTGEIGIEELATQLIQEEFLADGRLRVAPKERSDLQIAATIIGYDETNWGLDSDDIARRRMINMTVRVLLLDPTDDPFDPQHVIADLGELYVRSPYNSDTRSITYTVEPDRHYQAMNLLANLVVQQTITGFPVEIRGLPEGSRVPADAQTRIGLRGLDTGRPPSGYNR